jgi:hypothetical protein
MSAAHAEEGTAGARITTDHATQDHVRKDDGRNEHKELYNSTRTPSPRDRAKSDRLDHENRDSSTDLEKSSA